MEYSELQVIKRVSLRGDGLSLFAKSVEEKQPIIVKGAMRHWPIVKRAHQSDDEVMAFLAEFYNFKLLRMFVGTADMGGRFSYDAELQGFNFATSRADLSEVFEAINEAKLIENSKHFYVGSTDTDAYFPGLSDTFELPKAFQIFGASKPLVSVWIGNQTTAAAHYDMSNNLAICVAGRRRFTLFPPDQVANLYPGPLDPTPGGQVISMVDFDSPDYSRHPRFEAAMESAMVGELEPGDLLYYPALWWHRVEALCDFNVLINYWWNEADDFMDTPMITLLHGMLSLRGRTVQEKQAWRELFDYYVFGDDSLPREHIPGHARGPLAELDETLARRLRTQLLKKINR